MQPGSPWGPCIENFRAAEDVVQGVDRRPEPREPLPSLEPVPSHAVPRRLSGRGRVDHGIRAIPRREPDGMGVPESRVRVVHDAPVRADGRYVLYWMIAARRTQWNHGLDRAIEHARTLGLPLVVLEALRAGYPWASDRLHAFAVAGMADQRAAFDGTPVTYHAYVEPEPGAGSGLLETLAADAAVVVTDDFPCFFLPRMVAATGARLAVRLEAVDSNGVLPLAVTDREFARAYDFRRFVQRTLPEHLAVQPRRQPLRGLDLPRLATRPAAFERWPSVSDAELADVEGFVATLPIDHEVRSVAGAMPGGRRAGTARLRGFIARLGAYDEQRNHPDLDGSSGLSPYLHFGHVSGAEVVDAVLRSRDWDPSRLADRAAGQREGWWGLDASAEAFLDQVVTWRELGFQNASRRSDIATFSVLPDWAQRTLAEHAGDPREHVYSRAEFETAATHDEIWNAAQRQLRRDGRLHNYLRMLWGKKILEWSATPHEALETMIALNDRWALDGRDPNSYSGITWVLGRYDRPWGPERPIFGTIRFMSSANTRRKVRVREYLERYGAATQQELFPS